MKYFYSDWWGGFFAAISGWAVSFLMPVSEIISLVIVLVICDLITGIRAAKSRGEQIKSRRLQRTVEKIALFLIVIILSQWIKNIFMPVVPITYMSSLAIVATEFQSIVENVEAVTGVNIWSKIKNVFNRVNHKQ